MVLGIIGIVAEMTLPAVIQDAQDAQYKMGKDKVRMSIAEAGKILSVSGTITDGSSAQDFVENNLSKYLKIAKFCAPADMEQCGMPSGNPTTFKDLYNNELTSMPTTWDTITDPYDSESWSISNPTTTNFNDSYAFLSADGIAVNLFYNPYCKSSDEEMQKNDGGKGSEMTALDMACMAGVYDMNGLKKPNQVGRDIGFFATFYNGIQATSVAALPYKTGIDAHSYDWTAADNYCRGIKGQKLPTMDELSALYFGQKITGLPSGWLWSASSLPGSSYARFVYFANGSRIWYDRSFQLAVRCVRD